MEGPTADLDILSARVRSQRNLMATLLLSQGVPMLSHGDEIGRTQRGLNNGYAQDSEISWVNWAAVDEPLLEFTATLARLRAEHPTFRRKRFFTGQHVDAHLDDIVWLHPDGRELSPTDWSDPHTQAFGMLLGGEAIAEIDARGHAIVGESFLALINASPRPVRFELPPVARAWARIIDTRGFDTQAVPLPPEQRCYELVPRSLAVLWLTAPHATTQA